MQNIIRELKQHPSYWVLHKKFWQQEYDDLDKEIAEEVMRNPDGDEAFRLEKKVIFKISKNLLHTA